MAKGCPNIDDRAFLAHASAVVAKAKLVKAVKKVVPAETTRKTDDNANAKKQMAFVETKLPEDICWNFLQTGNCVRGLACQWRHGEETAEAAYYRRSKVLNALKAGAPATPAHSNQLQCPVEPRTHLREILKSSKTARSPTTNEVSESLFSSPHEPCPEDVDVDRQPCISGNGWSPLVGSPVVMQHFFETPEKIKNGGGPPHVRVRGESHGVVGSPVMKHFVETPDKIKNGGGPPNVHVRRESHGHQKTTACCVDHGSSRTFSPRSWADIAKTTPPGFE
jgi:hypothetical protein